jgi:hypothetical protein
MTDSIGRTEFFVFTGGYLVVRRVELYPHSSLFDFGSYCPVLLMLDSDVWREVLN